MYKIDWKVCFMVWAKSNSMMAEYHAFVEDDSFMCSENLLHQIDLLLDMPVQFRGKPFRTGKGKRKKEKGISSICLTQVTKM